MGRHKKNNTNNSEIEIKDDERLPNKSLFRIDEVARYFDITESSVYRWIDHGLIKAEKIVGSVRITREAILNCRFNK